MSFLINPYAFLAAGGDFESIATVTVGSGGAANIEFTSIPGTYQHLQIRGVFRTTQATTVVSLNMRLNGDTGSNYSTHILSGNGSAASAEGYSSQSLIYAGLQPGTSFLSDTFGATVIDVLDYASTTKNSTARALIGLDGNGSGFVRVNSGAWLSTSAVTSISLYGSSNFAQHTTAALYGIKAP